MKRKIKTSQFRQIIRKAQRRKIKAKFKKLGYYINPEFDQLFN